MLRAHNFFVRKIQRPRLLATKRFSSTIPNTHEIATYNVLSQNLAEPEWFCGCDPEVLGSQYRLKAIKKQLQRLIDRKAIIALQELSQEWAGDLHSYFSRQGYYIVSSHYGGSQNGYMGTAICFPLSHYGLMDCDLSRLGDKVVWQSADIDTDKLQIDSHKSQSPAQVAKAERRHNVQISLRLQNKMLLSEIFCVSTYHMPCAFRDPHVMTFHTALSAHHAFRFAGDNVPLILAGDFNFDPSSESYALLTSG